MSEIIETNGENPENYKLNDSIDTDFDPQYKPIITLPEIEISTNEENEIELFKIRAKLYRFDSQSDPPEWKERGTGELKLLRHNENNSVRVVMRRDKTLKVCANHFITPWMELKPNVGSERAFVYTVAADFADEMAKSECLAVKFGTVDNATLFKEKFEEAKKVVQTKCNLYNGKSDNEEQASSLDSEGSDKDSQEEQKTEDSPDTEVTQKMSELDVKNEDKEK